MLIRVAAAGVNRPDCLQRRGLYPPPEGASEIPGLEASGTVVACGDDVDWPAPGDHVCALLTGGGYAEYCVAPGVQCLPWPSGWSIAEAAALPEALFTVWSNVFERGALKSGETLLVHGGASGIGSLAIQLAHAMDARVLATAGSDEKTAFCTRLGAMRAINYRQERFAEVARREAGGVDVILDIVGGGYLEDNLKSLREDGRLVVIAVLGGPRDEINLARVMMRRLTVTGSTLRARPVAEKGRIAAALRKHVWPLLEDRRVVPVIQQTFPLHEAAAAHSLLEANAAMGKCVLVT